MFDILRAAMVKFVIASVLLFLFTSALGQAKEKEKSKLVIKGGTLVDVRTGEQIPDTLIMIEDDHITEIGRNSDIKLSNVRVIEARDKWIIPGLFDMHVHGTARSDVPLALYVANGVTSIRDMGGNLTSLRMVRQEIESGKKLGPRLFYAGYIVDGNPPSVPSIMIIADTAARADSAVNFLANQGVDLIKVYNNLPESVLHTIILKAKDFGLPVIGHVPLSIPLKNAVELGINGAEHSVIRAIDLVMWDLITSEEADKIASLPVTQRDALVWQKVDLESKNLSTLISLLAKKKVVLDPTLAVDEFDSLFLYESDAKHKNNRFLKRAFLEEALGTEHESFRIPSRLKDIAASGVVKRRQFIGKCQIAGVQIIAGTDGPGIGRLVVGFGLHHELQLLVEAGLTPFHAIQAATINAARALRKDKELGSIEAGKLADLVILTADPLADIHNTTKIDTVVLGGKVLDRKTLDATLAQVEADAKNEASSQY
jgi:hypothetical protein